MKKNELEKTVIEAETDGKRTNVLNNEENDVSRETVLTDTKFPDMYRLFRNGGMGRVDSLFNAAYLVCSNRYDESETDVKEKYKSVHSHPVSWSSDKKRIHRHNWWSLGMNVLSVVAGIFSFFGKLGRSAGSAAAKIGRIPKSMDNSMRAIKAFARITFRILPAAVAVVFGFYTWNLISANVAEDYAFGIYVDGEYKGTTDDIYGVLESKHQYERALSEKYGTPMVLNCNVTFKAQPYDASANYKTGTFGIYEDYVKKHIQKGFGLYIDNNLAAVAESEMIIDRTVNEFVELQKQRYISAYPGKEADESFVLSNSTVVVAAEYPKTFFLSENELRKLFDLPPLSDVVSDTSAGKIDELQYIKKENVNIADAAEGFTYSLNLDYTKLDRVDGSDGMNMNNSVPSTEVTLGVAIEKNETARKSIPYAEEIVYDDTILEGMRRLITKGVDGEKLIYYKSTYQDNKLVSRDTVNEEIIKAPVNKVVRVGTRVATEEEKALLPTGTYIYPYQGKLTSYYGWRTLRGQNNFHQGLDIFGPYESPIVAADGGEVIEVGFTSGYGNYCLIRHNEEIVTRYAHCTSIEVEEGDLVGQGYFIATMGQTGNVTGVHVHFEIIKNGKTVDPIPYMTGPDLPYVPV